MTMLSLGQAANLMPGATVLGDAAVRFDRVSTDSRTVGPGDLFIALRGEHFDAHDFLPEVAARGATAALVSRTPGDWSLPTLRVANTRLALGELAHGWRCQFDMPLVAVTGSNGKTTVKEMLSAIFAAAAGGSATLASRGNFNNDIGLPLTLLRLNQSHRLAVLELGMNHPGETEVLARLAEPTVAVVNNAQREHQEFMTSVEAVALEHASVIHALRPGGAAVFPADDAYEPIWRVAATGNRIVDFALQGVGKDTAAVVRGRRDGRRLQVDTPVGTLDVTLKVLGEHNARNALAATAAAVAAGVALDAIRRGLEGFESVQGRLQAKIARLASLAGATVIDDTYNANPDSMRAAIDVLASHAAPRVLVMGDMGEVGDHGAMFHREVGAYARERGIEFLYALGAATLDACQAYGANARHFDSVEALIQSLLGEHSGAATTLLVKGSRFMQMERVVVALVGPASIQVSGAVPGAH